METTGKQYVSTVHESAFDTLLIIPDQARENQWYDSSPPAELMFVRGPHLLIEKDVDSKNGVSLEIIHHKEFFCLRLIESQIAKGIRKSAKVRSFIETDR
jgi:hypothetical protein